MKSPCGRRRPFSCAVLALLAVGSACASERATTTTPPFGEDGGATTVAAQPTATPTVRTVAMIGDSITQGSELALRESLAALGLEIQAIDAEQGRRMTSDGSGASGVGAVTSVTRSGPPDLWVIALGTNDVGVLEGAESYATEIAAVVDAVPADVPLVWVDVYVEATPERSAEFNETLRDALRARGHATVVDWASLAETDGVLRDGIHPSGYGIEQFSRLVSDAVSDWMG